MIYSDTNNFMFYHMPKTAGSSITNILKPYCVGGHVKEFHLTRSNTHTAVEHTWDKYDGNKYFSFTFVRNPYDRVYSLYKFLTRIKRINCTFEIFILKMDREPSQYRLLNYKGNIPLSFIGKFENIENDFNFIANKININESYKDLPKLLKATPNKITYKDVYTDKLKSIIDEKHHDDFINFNYKKEL
jgi:hypothetical protein